MGIVHVSSVGFWSFLVGISLFTLLISFARQVVCHYISRWSTNLTRWLGISMVPWHLRIYKTELRNWLTDLENRDTGEAHIHCQEIIHTNSLNS
jgi:hypothetical protein